MTAAQGGGWSRLTEWRQGAVLPPEALSAFGLHNSDQPENTCAVVVAHDCDIASEVASEPMVEVIVGRMVPGVQGNYAWGKAARKLHLNMRVGDDAEAVELVQTNKQLIPKERLLQFRPDRHYVIDGKNLVILQRWLSARYYRSSFSESFVSRFTAGKADEKLSRLLVNDGAAVSHVFFNVDGGQNLERVEGDPHELSIVLVYIPGADPEASADAADNLADKVLSMLKQRLQLPAVKVGVCVAVSEDDFKIGQARKLKQWRLEHLSLRADDDQPYPVID